MILKDRRVTVAEVTYLRYITGDKIWIHYYNPENKHQSMEWKHLLSLIKRNFKI